MMKSIHPIFRRIGGMSRLMKWPLLCALLCVVMTRAAVAADGTYSNTVIVNYPLFNSSPPQIDATNFVNVQPFIINFTVAYGGPPFYETSDTVNYTNWSLMMANTGFQFDTQSVSNNYFTNRVMAGTFYNPGIISCGSTNDTTDPTGISQFGESGLLGYAQCLVNASNIMSPGVVDVGLGGIIQLAGENLDLTRARLTVEGGAAAVGGLGTFGLNTNYWDPSAALQLHTADSAPILLGYLYTYLDLTNSTAYFDFASPASNSVVIRSVFVEDDSGPDVTYNVYFNTGGFGLGSGNATVEWVGSYQDAATGDYDNDYLYLNDDYVLGASTNVILFNGYPDNFTFNSSTVKLLYGPATAQFYPVFPVGTVTNRYAYADVQIAAGTASINQVPNLSPTNLPGRVQINATHKLDLSMAQISGPNYLSLQATNEFDRSAGTTIQAPYSDLNLGVTNGFLTISNLLTPNFPALSGTVEAWSTRWLALATNTVDGTNFFTVTNDYRVLIVRSRLNPTTPAQVQNLLLHGTNSLVVSDALNVISTFNADAQNLTLTTNGVGYGATSVDGELNVANPSVFNWASALPNLRNLTNNGAIRLQNASQFVGTSNNTVAVSSAAAYATLSEVGGRTNFQNGNLLQIGTANWYYFQTLLTNTAVNQVKIAPTFASTMNNLIAAINGANGAGASYSTNTAANRFVTAGPLTGSAFGVTARTNGLVGNTIYVAASTSTTNVTWSSSHLTNGTAGYTNITPTQVPYYNFINHGLVSDQGSQIWADNFVSSAAVSNGVGSFLLQSLTTTLTNGSVIAGGDVSINTGSLLISNLVLEADRSLTLTVTNFLTDTGVTNGSVWTVGAASVGYGLSLPTLPATADGSGAYGNSLLGTTIYLTVPSYVNELNFWAARDVGASAAGYTNNMAIGRLILDAVGPAPFTQFTFNGAGVSNAIYVDDLELLDGATNRDGSGNLTSLNINPNLVIYYAQAVINGRSVAQKLDGKNNGHLRWMPAYAGHFSSTNLVFGGVTNAYNVALAQNAQIDSDGDGIPNSVDSTPFFLSGMINPVVMYQTNPPAGPMVVVWNSIPHATNYLFSATNSMGPFNDVAYFSTNLLGPFNQTNFISPLPYPSPPASVMVFVQMTNPPLYYLPAVSPWLTYPF